MVAQAQAKNSRTKQKKKYAFSEVHTTRRTDRQKGPPGSYDWVTKRGMTRSIRNKPRIMRALRHMRTPFGAVVAEIRNLAVSLERRFEGCEIHDRMRRKSWALHFHVLSRSHALNPRRESRVLKMRFLNVFWIVTISRIHRAVASHRHYDVSLRVCLKKVAVVIGARITHLHDVVAPHNAVNRLHRIHFRPHSYEVEELGYPQCATSQRWVVWRSC